MNGHEGVWRSPSAETCDYPGLWVCDDRKSGSITVGQSRLPLWYFVGIAVRGGWSEVQRYYSPEEYDFDGDDLAQFVCFLMEQRGEFGRLLCVLADVERREAKRGDLGKAWWDRKKDRRRVRAALTACLAALEATS